MGCAGSKGAEPTTVIGAAVDAPLSSAYQGSDRELVKNNRLSVRYQAKEIFSSARRSSAKFDKARIGTHTLHGVMPGPRGRAEAKINQVSERDGIQKTDSLSSLAAQCLLLARCRHICSLRRTEA